MFDEVELFELDTAHQRQLARDAANNEIKAGRLVRLSYCQLCGEREIMTEAHHADYARPKEVIFICPKCHRVADRCKQAREAGTEIPIFDCIEV